MLDTDSVLDTLRRYLVGNSFHEEADPGSEYKSYPTPDKVAYMVRRGLPFRVGVRRGVGNSTNVSFECALSAEKRDGLQCSIRHEVQWCLDNSAKEIYLVSPVRGSKDPFSIECLCGEMGHTLRHFSYGVGRYLDSDCYKQESIDCPAKWCIENRFNFKLDKDRRVVACSDERYSVSGILNLTLDDDMRSIVKVLYCDLSAGSCISSVWEPRQRYQSIKAALESFTTVTQEQLSSMMSGLDFAETRPLSDFITA